MAVNLLFWMAEGAKGLFFHRFTAVITILGMTLSLWLFGVIYVFWSNLEDYRLTLLEGFKLEIFLEPGSHPDSHIEIGEQIQSLNGIKEVTYISVDDAAKVFAQEFGDDLFDILEYNPLPASFSAVIESDRRNTALAEKLTVEIEKLPGVDEVVYQSTILELLEGKFNIISNSMLIFSLLIFSGTMIVFLQGIKLSMIERKNIIYTFIISGAKFSTIRLPFIFEGFITGTISGVLAYAGIFISIIISNIYLLELSVQPGMIIVIPAGAALGLFGAIISVRKNPQKMLVEYSNKYL